MTRVNVLHVVGGGEFGGAERSILDLLRHLPYPYHPAVAVFYQGRFANALRRAGIECLTVPNRGRYDWRLTGALRSVIRQNQISIVHTHGVRANFFGRLAARMEQKPVITTVHSKLEHDYPERSGRWLAWGMERFTQEMSSCYIAVSQGIKADLLQEAVPADQIKVIHNGVDLALLRQSAQRVEGLRQKMGLPEDRPLIGMIARLHPVKGHDVFFRAAARLLREGQDAHFVSVGEGHWRGEITRMADELIPPGRHTFTGFLENVAPLLREIDICINASSYEGLGLAILEAMALGIPTIASKTGGIPEIIEHGRNGFLFNPGDDAQLSSLTRQLLNDGERARRMGAEACRTVEERFQLQDMARHTADCYRRLIERRC